MFLSENDAVLQLNTVAIKNTVGDLCDRNRSSGAIGCDAVVNQYSGVKRKKFLGFIGMFL